MRHASILGAMLATPSALAAGTPLASHREQTPGVCHDLKAQTIGSLIGRQLSPGKYVFYLRRGAAFDVELVGGGGGGGAGGADKESPGGGGGGKAEYKPIFQRLQLERDYYLLEVGFGGAGGKGGWNHAEPPKLSDGASGGDTRVSRCISGATLAIAHGGVAGRGDGATTGTGRGNSGEDFVNGDTGAVIGHGGAGGTGGSHGGDGADASGHGAGGGGQGATLFQNDGKSHGGRGADGFARISRIG